MNHLKTSTRYTAFHYKSIIHRWDVMGVSHARTFDRRDALIKATRSFLFSRKNKKWEGLGTRLDPARNVARFTTNRSCSFLFFVSFFYRDIYCTPETATKNTIPLKTKQNKISKWRWKGSRQMLAAPSPTRWKLHYSTAQVLDKVYVAAFSSFVWYLNFLSNFFTKANDCDPNTSEDSTVIGTSWFVQSKPEYFSSLRDSALAVSFYSCQLYLIFIVFLCVNFISSDPALPR